MRMRPHYGFGFVARTHPHIHTHQLYAVVNNAGYGLVSPLELLSKEAIQQQFAVNVFGAIEVTRSFLPLLRDYGAGSRVVFISSVAGTHSRTLSLTHVAACSWLILIACGFCVNLVLRPRDGRYDWRLLCQQVRRGSRERCVPWRACALGHQGFRHRAWWYAAGCVECRVCVRAVLLVLTIRNVTDSLQDWLPRHRQGAA